jgi:hypothetical protein
MSETTSSSNSGQGWTSEQVEQLRDLAVGNTPVGVMSMRLGRSEDAIRSKARAEGISLSPPNRSPYGDMSRDRADSGEQLGGPAHAAPDGRAFDPHWFRPRGGTGPVGRGPSNCRPEAARSRDTADRHSAEFVPTASGGKRR